MSLVGRRAALRRVARGAALCLLVLSAGACAPLRTPGGTLDAAPPTLGLTDADRYSASTGAEPAPSDADLLWWRRFDDPALAAWVELALAHNVDVAFAAERVAQARALLRSARAQRGVQVAAQADAQLNLHRERGERRLQPSVALLMDFDADLWGGLRQAERAAAAGVVRSEHLVQAARLSTAALTARAYLEWRTALHDLRLLGDNAALLREALRVVNVRVEAGLAPVLDRDRAEAELAATEAERAAAQVRAGQALAALQVLAGERPQPGPWGTTPAPGDRQAPSPADRPLPSLQGQPPVGRPLDLVRLRPDLRAAEQALVAAAADIGVAEAALRPSLRLPGTLVFGSAMAGGGLLELASATVAAVLDATLYDGGRLQAGVDAARSRARESALLYRQTLLQALEQVEAALVAQQGAQARIEARQRATAAARAAEQQAQTLYRSGLSGYLDVVDAQRSSLANRRALLEAQSDAAAAAVATFEAMGLIAPDVEALSMAGPGVGAAE